MFEGEEAACSDSSAGMNLGPNFGMHLWFYVNWVLTDYTIWCKQQPTGADAGLSLCLTCDAAHTKCWMTVYDALEAYGDTVGIEDDDTFVADPDQAWREDVVLDGLVPQSKFFFSDT